MKIFSPQDTWIECTQSFYYFDITYVIQSERNQEHPVSHFLIPICFYEIDQMFDNIITRLRTILRSQRCLWKIWTMRSKIIQVFDIGFEVSVCWFICIRVSPLPSRELGSMRETKREMLRRARIAKHGVLNYMHSRNWRGSPARSFHLSLMPACILAATRE